MADYYEIEINLQSANLVENTSNEQDQDDAVGWLAEPTPNDTAIHTFTGVVYTTVPMVTIIPYCDWVVYLTADPVNDGAGTVTFTLKIGAAGSTADLLYKVRISEA